MTATIVPFHSSPEPALIPERVAAPEAEPRAVEGAEDFETLRDRGRELVAAGSYREAAAVYRQAAKVATDSGEADLTDEALCGWGAAETELGKGGEVMSVLRRILLGSSVDHNCWLASYTLARAHELEGQVKKALFYARLSHHHSEHASRPGLTGLSHNLLGNLLVAEGREADAATEYRTALRHAEDSPPAWIAGAETNLGYCLLVGAIRSRGLRRGRMREGLRLIYRSIRMFRREGAVQYSMLPHLDLCFAHLELDRPATARRHGLRALTLAKQYDDPAAIKNSLYLLGHVALQEGDSKTARQYFRELGHRFYPDQAGLTDVLMSLDLRQVVNLRA
jgi:tetratricopeptide (TPR) repeat protein